MAGAAAAALAFRRVAGSGIRNSLTRQQLLQAPHLHPSFGASPQFGDCRQISQLVKPIGKLPSSLAQVRGFSAQSEHALANASAMAKLRHAASDFVSLASISEVLADYVHHEMTRTMMVGCWRLFLLIAVKDAYLQLFF